MPGRSISSGGPAVFCGIAQVVRSRAGFLRFRAIVVGLALTLFASSSLAAPQSSTSTRAANPTAKKRKKTATSHRQLAPDPARIKEIQQALAREGFYKGEPTGKWDEESMAAMKNFQQAKGLQPTGKIEALSLQKLGLGSAVAGLAAPSAASQPAQTAPAAPAGAPQKP